MKYRLPISAVACLLALAACTQKPTPGQTPQPMAEKPPALVADQTTVVSKGSIPEGTPMVKVALLLPFSGDSSAIGASMLDAATMALYDSYLAVPSDQIRSQIILLPKDSGNTPAEAARAAKQAIDQGATFIVGPLFSQSVSAVAYIARDHNVPVLSFSNNKAIAGDGIYTFGFLPEQQVKRMSDYAFLHGYQRVALLAPNDPYGQKIQEALKQVYQKKGGLVSPTELYAPSPINIDAAASRMATTNNNTPEERRFQAIFIADGGNQLQNIINALKKTNIDLKAIKLIGTGLWDDPRVANIPELSGAWFSSSPPGVFEDFEQRFIASYHYKPVRLAGLSYDAITLLTKITMSSSQTTINTAALMDPRGYLSPANGLFRLKPDGTSDRRLSVMEVTPSGFRVIEPAQKMFEEKSEE